MTYAKEKINWPIIFVFILFLNYLIPLLLFGNITLFYHDSLDHEIVVNNILGKIYQGNLEALNLFYVPLWNTFAFGFDGPIGSVPLCDLSFAFTTLPNFGGITFVVSFDTVPSESISPISVSLAIL